MNYEKNFMSELKQKTITLAFKVTQKEIQEVVRSHFAKLHNVEYGATRIIWKDKDKEIECFLNIRNHLNLSCTIEVREEIKEKKSFESQINKKITYRLDDQDVNRIVVAKAAEVANVSPDFINVDVDVIGVPREKELDYSINYNF